MDYAFLPWRQQAFLGLKSPFWKADHASAPQPCVCCHGPRAGCWALGRAGPWGSHAGSCLHRDPPRARPCMMSHPASMSTGALPLFSSAGLKALLLSCWAEEHKAVLVFAAGRREKAQGGNKQLQVQKATRPFIWEAILCTSYTQIQNDTKRTSTTV